MNLNQDSTYQLHNNWPTFVLAKLASISIVQLLTYTTPLFPFVTGHAMRLVYFVSPYELLDVQAGRSITLTTETPSSRDLSHYVTVNIDASNSHKLQTTTLMIITKQPNGKK